MNTERVQSHESGEKESLLSRVVTMIVEGFNLKKAAQEKRTLFGTILNEEGIKLFNEGGDTKLSVGRQLAEINGFSKLPDFTKKLQEANENINREYYDSIVIKEKLSRKSMERWVDPQLRKLLPNTPVAIRPAKQESTRLAA